MLKIPLDKTGGLARVHVFGGRDPEDIINNYIEKKEINKLKIIDKKIHLHNAHRIFYQLLALLSLASETLTSFAKSYNLDLEQAN